MTAPLVFVDTPVLLRTADDRDPRTLTAAAVVSVAVPTDLLEIV